MPAPRRTARRHTALLAAVLGLLALLAGSLSPASASSTPPTPSSLLLGTWVNTNPSSANIAQVVISANGSGSIDVDAFGRCSPSLCEFGAVPAIVYAPSAGATVGTEFQAKLSTAIGERTMFGSVRSTSSGPQLSFALWTAYTDGSGRRNAVKPETFVLSSGTAPTFTVAASTAYPTGLPPKLKPAVLGTYTNASPGGITQVVVSGSPNAPTVEIYVIASGTPTSLGVRPATTYGPTISAKKGTRLLTTTDFSFKKTQLTLTYTTPRGRQPELAATYYNEFTDGSGRSNYVLHNTLVRDPS